MDLNHHLKDLQSRALNRFAIAPVIGCGGEDLHLRFPAYEAGEITTSLPRNVTTSYVSS